MKQFEDGKEHKLSCDATLADWLWHNMTSHELIAIYSIPGNCVEMVSCQAASLRKKKVLRKTAHAANLGGKYGWCDEETTV